MMKPILIYAMPSPTATHWWYQNDGLKRLCDGWSRELTAGERQAAALLEKAEKPWCGECTQLYVYDLTKGEKRLTPSEMSKKVRLKIARIVRKEMLKEGKVL